MSIQKDLLQLENRFDNSITDSKINTSNELTYTNKHFNMQIVASETKLIDKHNQLLDMIMDMNNRNTLRFESIGDALSRLESNPRSSDKSFKVIKSYFDEQKSNSLDDRLNVFESKLNLLLENLDKIIR